MKIISLNTWGGRALHPLLHSLKRHAPTTDVFCLQEVHDTTREYREARHPEEYVCPDLLTRIRTVLPGHDGYFARWADNPHRMSVAMFVRHDLGIIDYGTRTVLWPSDIHELGSAIISPRKLQYARLHMGGGNDLTVVNYHGMWRDTGKRDTPERIAEMTSLARFMQDFGRPAILAGDLNLDPDTKSIATLTKTAGLSSLLKRRNIRTTRTPLFRHWGDKRYSPYADYVFVTPDLVRRSTLSVLSDVASDHAALCLDLRGGGR